MCVIFFFQKFKLVENIRIKIYIYNLQRFDKWCLVFKSLIGGGIYNYILIQNYFENYIIKNIIEFDKIQC